MKKFKSVVAAVLGTVAIVAAVTGTAYAEKSSAANIVYSMPDLSNGEWFSDGWQIGDEIEGLTYLGDGIYVEDTMTYQEPVFQVNEEDFNTDGLVVLNEQEAVVGDYRYVDTIYTDEIGVLSNEETKRFWAYREIYYEPDNTQSIHLATMFINAFFTWDTNANTVSVDSSTAKYGFDQYVTGQTYPIIKKKTIAFNDNQGGFIGKKYASVRYVLDVERAKDQHFEWALELDVNVEGTPTRKYK